MSHTVDNITGLSIYKHIGDLGKLILKDYSNTPKIIQSSSGKLLMDKIDELVLLLLPAYRNKDIMKIETVDRMIYLMREIELLISLDSHICRNVLKYKYVLPINTISIALHKWKESIQKNLNK